MTLAELVEIPLTWGPVAESMVWVAVHGGRKFFASIEDPEKTPRAVITDEDQEVLGVQDMLPQTWEGLPITVAPNTP